MPRLHEALLLNVGFVGWKMFVGSTGVDLHNQVWCSADLSAWKSCYCVLLIGTDTLSTSGHMSHTVGSRIYTADP